MDLIQLRLQFGGSSELHVQLCHCSISRTQRTISFIGVPGWPKISGQTMAICPRCGASYQYSEPHACSGRDYRWTLWAVVATVAGALAGYRVALHLSQAGIAAACAADDAPNLCGFFPSVLAPALYVIGVGIGAFIAAVAAILIYSYGGTAKRRQAGDRRN